MRGRRRLSEGGREEEEQHDKKDKEYTSRFQY